MCLQCPFHGIIISRDDDGRPTENVSQDKPCEASDFGKHVMHQDSYVRGLPKSTSDLTPKKRKKSVALKIHVG